MCTILWYTKYLRYMMHLVNLQILNEHIHQSSELGIFPLLLGFSLSNNCIVIACSQQTRFISFCWYTHSICTAFKQQYLQKCAKEKSEWSNTKRILANKQRRKCYLLKFALINLRTIRIQQKRISQNLLCLRWVQFKKSGSEYGNIRGANWILNRSRKHSKPITLSLY